MRFSSLLSTPTGFISLKVDSPSDIIFLEPSKFNPILADVEWSTSSHVYHYPFTTAEQWKSVRNKFFMDNLFVPAAALPRACRPGLRVGLAAASNTFRLNRAQAYIWLEFSAVLGDALHILSSPGVKPSCDIKEGFLSSCMR